MENECLVKNAIPSIQDEIKNEAEKKEKIKGNFKKEEGKIVIEDPVVKITFRQFSRVCNRNTIWNGNKRSNRKQKKLLIWTILLHIWSRCSFDDTRTKTI